MTDFGPFDDYADALSEACSLILSKPNASVTHIKDRELALRVSSEYCAWMYYTPDGKYRMSMLTDQSEADDLQRRRRTCKLPPFVDDPRFSPWDIKYVFALHNHPFGSPISRADMQEIINLAKVHEWVVETKDGRIPIAIVAFFSDSSSSQGAPACDGFYQYVPETRALLRFSRVNGEWLRKKLGKVTWLSSTTYRLDEDEEESQ